MALPFREQTLLLVGPREAIMKNKFFLSFVLIILGSQTSSASTLSVSGDSEFVAVGRPSAMKIHGQGAGLSGTLTVDDNSASGNVKFALDQFSTGVELRDHHMKEKYLEIQKYPTASLALDKIKLASNLESGALKEGKIDKLAFTGHLNLHGITHPVTGTIDLNTSAGVTKGDGQFEIKISDYNINVPTYLGITVADTVEIRVHLEAKKANGSG
jgi:polyisoprenoid-binding protein YceI